MLYLSHFVVDEKKRNNYFLSIVITKIHINICMPYYIYIYIYICLCCTTSRWFYVQFIIHCQRKPSWNISLSDFYLNGYKINVTDITTSTCPDEIFCISHIPENKMYSLCQLRCHFMHSRLSKQQPSVCHQLRQSCHFDHYFSPNLHMITTARIRMTFSSTWHSGSR